MEAMKLPVAGFAGRRVLFVGAVALLVVFFAGRTARAQLLSGCENPPFDEPDGDGDECYQQQPPDKSNGGPSTDTNGHSCPTPPRANQSFPPANPAPGPGQNGAGTFCGDPVNLTTGNNYRTESDYTGAGAFPLMLTRAYNSLSSSAGSFGANWTHNFGARIVQVSATLAQAVRADGKLLTFRLTGSVWAGDSDVNARLAALIDTSGALTGWKLTNGLDGAETYSADGRLLSVSNRAGLTESLAYDTSSRLTSVSDPFGRKLSFTYDAQNRIATATDPAGGKFTYGYDASNNLASVAFPDGSSRSYVYENTTFPHALTGIVDENGIRFATWSYNAQGLAVSSVLAGGVAQHTFSYDFSNGVSTDTDALGHTRTFSYITAAFVQRTLHDTKPLPGSPTDNRNYDNNGNISQYIDFRGITTNYVFDLVRNLEVSRTEAVGTAQQRTITTTWHPTFRLPVQIVEPNRTTTFSYDAQGNLLTRTVSGASAADRTWTFQYNANGQVTQIDGPRLDAVDITTFAYDAKGNLVQVTDALGHVTKVTAFDAHGRPLTVVAPNGLTTKLVYDARARLLSRQRGTETTKYAYDAAGQLIKLTFPDGTFVSLGYDPAHRLTSITDNLGNRVAYTLDLVGNGQKDEVFDPSSTLARTHSRAFDAINRVAKSIGAAAQATSFSYDADDNLISILDPLNRLTTVAFDSLNRPSQATDPLGSVTRDVLDANDNLSSLTDPLAHATLYSYDGLSDGITTTSPDTGLIQNAYDGAANVVNRTDARGLSTGVSYDAINRLSTLDFSGGSVAFTYDQGTNSPGHLTQMVDTAGTTKYTYDALGRVLQRSQKIGHHTLTISYAYDASGRLSTMTYPSGLKVGLVYTNGLVTQITANGSPVMSNIKYLPFGPPISWTWGNGVAYTRQFDQDGRLTTYGLGGGRTRTVAYDAASRITSYSDTVSPQSQIFGYDSLDRLTSASGAGISTSYGYDSNGNRLSLTGGAGTASYTYEATSNRLLSVGAPAAQTFGYDGAGNITGDGANTFTYDGLGRLTKVTNAKGRVFTYLYNGFGQRVAKLKNVTPTTDDTCDNDGDNDADDSPTAKVARYFAYDEAGHLVAEEKATGNPSKETIYLGDLPVAVVNNDKKVLFVYADHLNAPRAIMNPKGVIVWRWEGDPFGSTLPNQDPDADGNALKYNVRFPGQYFDKETGLHYNNARFYSAFTGRYLEADPIGERGGLNLYQYANGNPVRTTDVAGLTGSSSADFPHDLDRTVDFWVSVYNFEAGNHLGDREYLDPDLIKAMIMQESGNNATAHASDPMQVNVLGDWVPEKEDYGLVGGICQPHDVTLPAAIDWLANKAYRHDSNGDPVAFRGWPAAISRYNGGGDPEYVNKVLNYYDQIKGQTVIWK